MVEMTAEQTAEHLGITINNLRQIQFRGNLKWIRRESRRVYYSQDEVLDYAQKRSNKRNKTIL